MFEEQSLCLKKDNSLCSKKDNPCVRRRKIPCVRRRTILVFEEGHSLCSNKTFLVFEDDETPIFGRTDLRKGVSEAKFDAEADFDVKKCLAPPKLAENRENRKNNPKNFPKKISASKNRKLQIVRNAFSRSFAAIGSKFEGERNFDAVQNQK